MNFIDERKRARLANPRFSVSPDEARIDALFAIYLLVAGGFWGTKGWERGRIASHPIVIHDLCGLPLFYSFSVYRGSKILGVIRTAATKLLGNPLVSVQITPSLWSLGKAKGELQSLLRRNYAHCDAKKPFLVCHNYPTVALAVEVAPRRGAPKLVLMNVASFNEIRLPTPSPEEFIGEVAYSLLARLSRARERYNPARWEIRHQRTVDVIRRRRALSPRRFFSIPPQMRAKKLMRIFSTAEFRIMGKTVDLEFCSHKHMWTDQGWDPAGWRTHRCFCRHPQEIDAVDCARAVSQMILCYWRYCYSQGEIAGIFGEGRQDLTGLNNVEDGLEKATAHCFDAVRHTSLISQNWNLFTTEIDARRPVIVDNGGHYFACAGYGEYGFADIPERKLLLYDPSASGTPVALAPFNPLIHNGAVTLTRRDSTHV